MYQRRSRAVDTARVLRSGLRGTVDAPINNQREPTVLLRALPAAASSWSPAALAEGLAALTHGDTSARAATALFAIWLHKLLVGEEPAEAWASAQALRGPAPSTPGSAAVLAWAVARTVEARDPRAALFAALDEASPPSRALAVLGASLGARFGCAWVDPASVDLGALAADVADDLHRCFGGAPNQITEEDWLRYPG
jgi:hypothetical protein